MDVKLFQHLRDASDTGLSLLSLTEKTGVEAPLLQRIMYHLNAMKLVTFSNGKFFATTLSNGLAEERYQESIKFCYDVARPSFNGFPKLFIENGYKAPADLRTGPFQAAHKSDLAFFDWLDATPPHLAEFDAFMSAYRAGKPNWYDPGFYPVAERLIEGFDSGKNEVLLVDVGGGRGHDISMFAAQHPRHPEKLVLQDREQVIASIAEKKQLPFECHVHDFYTPEPIKGARAYSLHSVLHDWDDERGIKILESLKPALIPGYSRVLLNEIVLSEEHPSLAATSMDMMMLAHMSVHERTEGDWRRIIEKAGLRFVRIYNYPGVTESVIEAELADAGQP